MPETAGFFSTDRRGSLGQRPCDRDPCEGKLLTLFMVVERYRGRNAEAVYRRFRERGRMTPEGLKYVGSWVEANFDRCFQLMGCDDARLLQRWVANWKDLVEFEIVPVVSGEETAESVAPTL